MKKIISMLILFAMILSMLVPVGAIGQEGVNLVMSGNNIANTITNGSNVGLIGSVGASGSIGANGAGASGSIGANGAGVSGSVGASGSIGASGTIGANGAGTTTTFRTEVDKSVAYDGTNADTATYDEWDSKGAKDQTFYDALKNRDTAKENVFEIWTAEQWYAWHCYRQDSRQGTASSPNEENKDPTNMADVTIKLMVDLDLKNYKVDVTLDGTATFAGKFYGNGHVIANFVTTYGSGGKGFFGCIIGNAMFDNVVLSSGTITIKRGNTSDETSVGTLFGNIQPGSATNTITLSNLYSAVDISLAASGHKAANTKNIGGIAGVASGSGKLKVDNCVYKGTISDAANTEGKVFESVGGLIGESSIAIDISKCEVAATLIGGKQITAGLVGKVGAVDILVKDCKVYDTTITTPSRCGGLFGYLAGSQNVTISNCVVDATLNASSGLAGGLIANATSLKNKVSITNCSVSGSINAETATSVEYAVAGLMSRVYTSSNVEIYISNCKIDPMTIKAGGVYAASAIGFLRKADCSYSNVTVTNCSYNGTITGSKNVGGMIGYVGKELNGTLTLTNNLVSGKVECTSATVQGVGGLVGYLASGDDVTIENNTIADTAIISSAFETYTEGETTVTGAYTGGLIGRIEALTQDFTVTNCLMAGTVTAKDIGVGGVIGTLPSITGTLTFDNCSITGKVEGKSQVGGLIGEVPACGTLDITNCSVPGTITATENYAGGLVGNVVNATSISIESCAASATVNAAAYAGGLVGNIAACGDLTIKNNKVSSSTVKGSRQYVGGLLGRATKVSGTASFEDCVVDTATIESTMSGSTPSVYVGGLAGSLEGPGSTYTAYTLSVKVENVAVTNVTVAMSDSGRLGAGMFGYLTGVAGIEIQSSTVTGSVEAESRCAGMIAYTNGIGAITISDCYADLKLYSTTGLVGGLATNINNVSGDINITNCKVEGEIFTPSAGAGGLYGASAILCRVYSTKATINVTIKHCTAKMNIDADAAPGGGMIAHLKDGTTIHNVTVENCEYSGVLKTTRTAGADSTASGGMIGGVDATLSGNLVIRNCKVSSEKIESTFVPYAYLSKGENKPITASYTAGIVGEVYSCKDVVIENCSVDAKISSGGQMVGGVIGQITGSTSNITLKNIQVDGSVSSTFAKFTYDKYPNSTTDKGTTNITGTYVGGLIAQINSPISGNLTVTSCVSNTNLSADSNYAGGLIGCVASTVGGNIAVSDCKFYGDIDAKGGYVAGVIGRIYNAISGDLKVSNCAISSDISCTGSSSAGVIGQINNTVAGDLIIDECSVAGTIKCNGSAGGLIGAIAKKITGTTTVDNCEVSATIISTGPHNGGFFGNIDGSTNGAGLTTITNSAFTGSISGAKNTGALYGFISSSSKNDYVFKNCVSTGAVTGNRGSGGFLGYFSCRNIVMENIEVSGALNLTTDDYENNSVGGVIGRFAAVSNATLKDVVFSGTLKATIAPIDRPEDKPDAVSDCHVGGLIGYIASHSAIVKLEDCHVNATLYFSEAGKLANMYNKGMAIFIGGGHARIPNVIYGENITYHLKGYANATTKDVTLVGPNIPSMGNTAVLGYQIKWNDDDTYDLRYVIGMKDVYQSVGVQAEIRYNYGDGVKVRYENIRIKNVYAEVQSDVVDGKRNTYRAADFAMDYLYTLTITDIPKEYAVHAGDLQVALIPYGVSNGVTEFGVTTVQGDMGGFVELNDSDFGKTKPEAIDDAPIHIWAGDYNVEETVKPATAKASAKEDAQEGKGPGKNISHWYTNANTVLVYNFTVEEEGWYDAYFYLRLKNESIRYNKIVISNGETEEIFTLFYEITSTHTGLRDDTSASYVSNAFEVHLTPGEYTMTILPAWISGTSTSSLHYRDIYFVKQ